MKHYDLQVTREEMKTIGQRFRRIREELGISQREMAEHIGVFATTIYRWEKGERIPKRDLYEINMMYEDLLKKHRKRG